jgi:hypothetical protein
MATKDLIDGTLKLATGLRGASPRQPCYSIIYGECRKPDGAFVKVSKCQIALRDKPKAKPAARKAAAKPKAPKAA